MLRPDRVASARPVAGTARARERRRVPSRVVALPLKGHALGQGRGRMQQVAGAGLRRLRHASVGS